MLMAFCVCGSNPASLLRKKIEMSMRALDAVGAAVLAAEEELQQLRKSDFDEMKSLTRPPPAVADTALAAKILVDAEHAKAGADADGMTFGSSATIILVCWHERSVQKRIDHLVYENPMPMKKLARLRALEESGPPVFPSASAVYKFIRAVVSFYYASAALDAVSGEPPTLAAWKRDWQEKKNT